MSIFFPVALFYAALLALALWGAWLGWTRSKSPTARVFVTAMALVWAGFTVADAWSSYRFFGATGVAEIISAEFNTPVGGSHGVCSFCYEGPAGEVYVIAAARIDGAQYTFSEKSHYALRFESGDVRLDGRRLEPGCHEGEAELGTRVSADGARGFRLEVGEAARCD